MTRASDFLSSHWEVGADITYTFNVSSLGYSEFSASYQTTFETGMSQWSSVANINFVEVSDPNTADWLIAWDPNPDGYGGVLGTAQNFDWDGDGILETSESEYSLILMDPYDTASFYSTGIHEAGHALGISHIDHTSSIMESYENGLQGLTDYDVTVVQSIYGAPGSSSAATTTTVTTTTSASVGSEYGDYMSISVGSGAVFGASGADTMLGSSGDDLIYGNRDNDQMFGGSGNDTLFGGQNGGWESGDFGRDGIETLSGGAGNDLIYGNFGAELIYGDSGSDTIYGGQDSGTIIGGSGWDDLYGNLGSDTFVFSNSNEGWDWIYGFDTSEDKIQLDGVTVSSTYTWSSGTAVVLSSGTDIDLIGVYTSDISGFIEYV